MNYELELLSWFENMGFSIQKIPESDLENPDFLISDSESSYLLELKTKLPSPEDVRIRESALLTQHFYTLSERTEHRNRLSGIIGKATDQLKANVASSDTLRLVWLMCTGHTADARLLQFEATLYGSAWLLDVTNHRSGTCFFFSNSDFFRYRDVLDAAIVSTDSGARLLLNPLSPHFDRMRNSSLTTRFGSNVTDPVQMERDGTAFILQGDVDRSNRETVLEHLRGKYHSENLVPIDMHMVSGEVVIARPEGQ